MRGGSVDIGDNGYNTAQPVNKKEGQKAHEQWMTGSPCSPSARSEPQLQTDRAASREIVLRPTL